MSDLLHQTVIVSLKIGLTWRGQRYLMCRPLFWRIMKELWKIFDISFWGKFFEYWKAIVLSFILLQGKIKYLATKSRTP